jgi:hypothetical protein
MIRLLYLRYYFLLKKWFPSYLGIEDTASACIVGTLLYVNILTIYMLVCKYVIEFYYFNEVIFYLAYLSIVLFYYYYFVLSHRKGSKIYKLLKEKAQSNLYTLIAIVYPMMSVVSIYYAFKIVF